MTDSTAELRARAQEAFRKVAELVREDAIAGYRAKHQAEVDKAARLKAMRMAAEAQPAWKAKRP
jgi:hypothetical protein